MAATSASQAKRLTSFAKGVNWALASPEWRAKALQERKEIDDLLSKPLHEVAGLRTEAAQPASNDDELIEKAKTLVIQHQRASISLINRHLKVSCNQAGRLMDALEKDGIVGPHEPNRGTGLC